MLKKFKNFRKPVLFFICASVVSTLRADLNQEALWDTEADKQITMVVKSNLYNNQEILYSYAGLKWHLRCIRAPHNEELVCGSLTSFCPFYLLTKETVPDELFAHLQELPEKFLEPESGGVHVSSGFLLAYKLSFTQLRVFENNGLIFLSKGFIESGRFFSNGGSFNGCTSFEYFENPSVIAAPLQIGNPDSVSFSYPYVSTLKIDDPCVDAQIQEIWQSKTFINRVFHYELEEENYYVCIIHNPDYLSLEAKQEFKLNGEKWLCGAEWNCRYGIIIDKKAPQKLIDHLSQLVKLSWYDWFFSHLKIYNGSTVKVKIDGREYRTIPWFYFVQDLYPDESNI